jgi:hypothetical protein
VIVCGGHREVFCQTRDTDSSPLVLEVYIEIYLDKTSGMSHPTSQQEEHPRMSFKNLLDETFTKA